jgi:hypothetical protein
MELFYPGTRQMGTGCLPQIEDSSGTNGVKIEGVFTPIVARAVCLNVAIVERRARRLI